MSGVAARFASKLALRTLSGGLPQGICLNVNVPYGLRRDPKVSPALKAFCSYDNYDTFERILKSSFTYARYDL